MAKKNMLRTKNYALSVEIWDTQVRPWHIVLIVKMQRIKWRLKISMKRIVLPRFQMKIVKDLCPYSNLVASSLMPATSSRKDPPLIPKSMR